MDEPIRLIVAAADPLVGIGLEAMLNGLDTATVIARISHDGLEDPESLPGSGVADAIVWDLSGEDDLAELLDDSPLALPVVALVADEVQAGYALNAGCAAVLLRQTSEEAIVAAAEAVLAGLTVLSPELVAWLTPDADLPGEDFDELTPREAEVLDLLAEGLTNKAIAYSLSISEHTVKFHVNAILSKLDAQSRTEAVVTATRLGLISL